MKRKTIMRLLTDGLMAGFLLVSMANRLTENPVHEVVGFMMLVFFVMHQVLNWRWYQAIFKGRYNMRRTVNSLVNAMLVMVFVLLSGTSVMISQTAFSFLGTHGSLNLRQLHITSAYWFMILSGVHLGIQFQRLVRMAGKVSPIFQRIRLHKHLRLLIGILIVSAGIYASFDRNLGAKLFMTYAFDFWDFDQSIIGFFMLNLSIMGLYAVIAHSAMKFLTYERIYCFK